MYQIYPELPKLATKQAIYIAKALKAKYNLPITKTINKTNFNEFYSSLNKTVNCDEETTTGILKIINDLKENPNSLINEGEKIFSEESKFKTINWTNVISNIKNKFKFTNKKLGENIGCGYKNFSFWENGTKNPNYDNCKKILKFINQHNLDLENLSKPPTRRHTYKDKYEKIRNLTINEEIAEFIGILNGDGTITKSGLIVITGNSTEDLMHHITRIKTLSKKCFDKKTTTKIKKSVVASGFTSRYISKQLKKLGLPNGKKNNLRIPKPILNDKKLLKSYLRGLFDTDGTICRRNKHNIRIGYGSFREEMFTKEVFYGLKKLDFNAKFAKHEKYRAEIGNDNDVIKFFKEIGSCNYSKVARFIYWRLFGVCPSYDYNTFKAKLKEKSIDVEEIKTPFLWDKKYIYKLKQSFQSELLPKIEEDEMRLKIIKSNINWKEKISFLKEKFNIKN